MIYTYIIIIITIFILLLLIYRYGEVHTSHTKLRMQTKENRKKFILDFLQHHPKITNEDVREMFDISSQTALNYLDELELEGKIVQIGEHGRGVYYTLK